MKIKFFFLVWCSTSTLLFSQNFKKEFDQHWKTENIAQQAYAISLLAKFDTPEAAKLLIKSLKKSSKKIQKLTTKIEKEKAKLATLTNPFAKKATQKKLTALEKKIAEYDLIFNKSKKTIAAFKNEKAIEYIVKSALKPKSDLIKIKLIESIASLKSTKHEEILLKALRHHSLEIRIATIVALREQTPERLLKFLIEMLADPNWEIQVETCITLLIYNELSLIPQIVQTFLQKTTNKESLPFLQATLKNPYPPVRQMAVLALQQHDAKEAFAPLLKLLSDDSWQVRATVIETLAKYDNPQAIKPLIQQLSLEKGRLIDDIEEALYFLTGEKHHGNPQVWKIRLKSEAEKWMKKIKKEQPKNFNPALRGLSSYYFSKGIKEEGSLVLNSSSKRMLYILDISKSMSTLAPKTMVNTFAQKTFSSSPPSKIKVLIQRLRIQLSKLNPKQKFSILLFNEKVFWWKKELVLATPENIKEARKYISKIEVSLNTDTFIALDEAFHMNGAKDFYLNYTNGVDTIFLISDGMPSTGLYPVRSGELQKKSVLKFLDAAKAINTLRNIKIHTIGIPPDTMDALLGGLAADSSAIYQYWK